jgi:hypothetical protein
MAATLPTDDQKFAIRWSRLRTVCQLLEGLHRDYANNLIAEKRNKAEQYLNSDPGIRSHGEREAYASAHTIDFTAETLSIKGQITALEEERDFIRFALEHDAETQAIAS